MSKEVKEWTNAEFVEGMESFITTCLAMDYIPQEYEEIVEEKIEELKRRLGVGG